MRSVILRARPTLRASGFGEIFHAARQQLERVTVQLGKTATNVQKIVEINMPLIAVREILFHSKEQLKS